MPLAGAVDAIGPVQAGIEPLRAVGRAHLPGQHVAHLVVEGLGVVLGVEIAALPAPIGPGAGHAVEHLAGRWSRRPVLAPSGLGVGLVAPQPLRARPFPRPVRRRRRACRPCGNTSAPGRRTPPATSRPEPRCRGAKHHRSVGIADLAGGGVEGDARHRQASRLGEMTLDPHVLVLWRRWTCRRGIAADLAVSCTTTHRLCQAGPRSTTF